MRKCNILGIRTGTSTKGCILLPLIKDSFQGSIMVVSQSPCSAHLIVQSSSLVLHRGLSGGFFWKYMLTDTQNLVALEYLAV